jgi:hypothetical protein
VYWHRELPPLDAEVMGEHMLEAASGRVSGTLAHRDEVWNRCYEDLMVQTRARLEQEIARLDGEDDGLRPAPIATRMVAGVAHV